MEIEIVGRARPTDKLEWGHIDSSYDYFSLLFGFGMLVVMDHRYWAEFSNEFAGLDVGQ